MQTARPLPPFPFITLASDPCASVVINPTERWGNPISLPTFWILPSTIQAKKIRSHQATSKFALHAASLSLTTEQDCRLSQAAGWLEKQLVASGPPALSRAVAHIIMSSFCPQETQQASGSLETPESKGQALAVRVCRCFCGEGFFVSFIELQLLCRFIFFMYPLLISGSLSSFFPWQRFPTSLPNLNNLRAMFLLVS